MSANLKRLLIPLGVALALWGLPLNVSASSFSLEAGVFSNGVSSLGSGTANCPGGGTVTAQATHGPHFSLAKTSPTEANCSAFIVVNGLGSGITGLHELSFKWAGAHCGAGAPRFNVTTSDGKTHFYGCTASNVDGRVSIDPSNASLDGSGNGGVSTTDTVTAISIVFDEQGSVSLSNIDVNGAVIGKVVEPVEPSSLSLEAGVFTNGQSSLGSGTANCPGEGTVTAQVTAGPHFFLSKTSPTSANCSAFIVVKRLGSGITGVHELSFDWTGAHCGAGAPRFNVTTSDGKTHFYGCAASNVSGHVSIDPSNTSLDGSGNGGVSMADTVTAIAIVFDEQGSVTLSNIDVNGAVITRVEESVAPSSLSLEAGVFTNGQSVLGSGTTGCLGEGTVTAQATAGPHFFLSKTSPTSANCSAFIVVKGLGSGITGLHELSFDWTGAHCGAGAPRFNVTTSEGQTHFFGCAASDTNGHVSIDPSKSSLDGSGNGGVSMADTVTAISIVFDEQGSVTLSNIDVNSAVITAVVEEAVSPPPPAPVPAATPTPTAATVPTPSPIGLPITAPTTGTTTGQVSRLATTGSGGGVPWSGAGLLLGMGLLLVLTGGVLVARTQFRRY